MKFVVYTRMGVLLHKSKTGLSAKGFPYEEMKLDQNFNREEFYAKFGRGSTFPQVLLDLKRSVDAPILFNICAKTNLSNGRRILRTC